MPDVTSRTGKPIVIAEYDPSWPERFRAERDLIERTCLPGAFVRIEHVGSTAVPGLAAKPIIDIMPGVRSLDAFMPNVALLASIGYAYVPEFEQPMPDLNDPGMPFRRYFRKDVNGARAFHLHTVEVGSDFWRDHQLFRNWLKYSAEDRDAYDALKRQLASEFNATLTPSSNVNVGYTDRKSDLINAIMVRAKAKIAQNTPIVLALYDPRWPEMFAEVHDSIAPILGDVAVAIEHVGSTSVPGLTAKPTIDVAIGVRSMNDATHGAAGIAAIGFRGPRWNTDDWVYYAQSRTDGSRSVHLHVVEHRRPRWNAYLDFRDYLRTHGDAAAAYEQLKRDLAAEFVNDRLGYPEAKSAFVEGILAKARAAGDPAR